MAAVGPRIFSEIDIPSFAEAIGARGYALVLTDEPPKDGADVVAFLRRWQPGRKLCARIPEIAIARGSAALAAALDAGAADAVALPIDAVELAARVDARVRNHLPRPIEIGDLRIDPTRRLVSRAGHAISLLPREFALLIHLAEHRGEYVSRRDLLGAVWKLRNDPGTNVLAVHVSKLRAKIDRHFAHPLIQGARGLGYRLEAG